MKLAGLKLIRIDEQLARRHYAVHESRPFFAGLVEYITSGPVVVAVATGKQAIGIIRSTVGATNPVAAAPGTIRGDFAVEIGRNLIHASDSPENGEQEIALFFKPEELVTFERSTDPWIYE